MSSPRYNLLIVHTPGAQDVSDWVKVSEMIHARAPDIEVRVANNRSRNSATRKWQVRRPSLVFSPYHLATFQPLGGKVYAGRQYSKLEQYERFKAAGVATPRTVELTSETRLDPAEWGEHVIVKPARQSFGNGVRLIRTAELEQRSPELLTGSARTMMAQQFIDTGPRPSQYRVLTLFGCALYAHALYAEPVTQPDQPIAPSGVYKVTANLGRDRPTISDPDVLELAARMHAAMPEVPVQGADIIREASSGRLYAIEANPGGNVWHLSSPGGQKAQATLGMNYYEQFGALDIVADELIQRTRAEAY
jgi:hypothetical protein